MTLLVGGSPVEQNPEISSLFGLIQNVMTHIVPGSNAITPILYALLTPLAHPSTLIGRALSDILALESWRLYGAKRP